MELTQGSLLVSKMKRKNPLIVKTLRLLKQKRMKLSSILLLESKSGIFI
jgi:hypothetical protein